MSDHSCYDGREAGINIGLQFWRTFLRRPKEWRKMTQLRAWLTKIVFCQSPAFFPRSLSVGIQVKCCKEHRRNRLTSTLILFRVIVDLLAAGDELLRCMSHGKPTVSEHGDAPQGIVVITGSDPNWHRPLNRLGLDADFVKAIIFSFKGKGIFSPQAAHQADGFVEASRSLVKRYPTGLKFSLRVWILVRSAYADDDPAGGDDIQRCPRVCQEYRVPEGHGEWHRADLYPAGLGRYSSHDG